MTKKVKSFNVDEATYSSLIALLKEYETEASISSFLDKYLRELLAYFKAMESELTDDEERKDIMRFIIEAKAASSCVHVPDKETPGEGEPGLNRIWMRTVEPQILSAIAMEGGREREVKAPDIDASELDEEIAYWRDEYEASKKKLSRAFVKHLRSGRFVLSTDRRYLIEKETGKKYIDFAPNYIIEIATGAGDK